MNGPWRKVAVVVAIGCGVLASLVLGVVALYVIAFLQWGNSK